MRPAVCIFCVLLLSAAGCGRKDDKPVSAAAASAPLQRTADGAVVIPPDSPKLQQIRVDTVRTAEIATDEVVSPGKIEVDPNKVSRVVLPVTGRVTSVFVRIGDAVRQGQPLLEVESPDADAAESAYLQAQAALTQAKAALLKAQADYDRASDLLAHSAVAQKEVLNAQNAVAQARAAVEQGEAAAQQSARRLAIFGLKPGIFGQKVIVNAPMSGKVLDMSVAPGEYRNDTNSAVMTIANLSTVWVSSDVPESSIRLIQPGERIDVTLAAYPGQVFRGRVTRIADTVDPQTRTIKVRAEMDNARGLFRPEMYGTIRHTESTRILPVVPAGAVIQGDGASTVYLEDGPGRFRAVEVGVGKRIGDVLPVLKGLKAGDRIVIDGAMLLKAQ